MIEGFADWFGRVYTSVAQNQTRNYEFAASGADLGDSVPGRVAQFLWDITDRASSDKPVRDTDNDEVKVFEPTIGPRYAQVARLMHLQATNRDFAWVWQNRVKTLRPADQIPSYCKVAKRNTITVTGCP